MGRQKITSLEKPFLLISGIGLIPIALSYGLGPDWSLDLMFGIRVDSINHKHIFRGVMGLYFGMSALWFVGAFRLRYRLPALICLTFFMFGIAFGRIVSMITDGNPNIILWIYLGLECIFGIVGLYFLRHRISASG